MVRCHLWYMVTNPTVLHMVGRGHFGSLVLVHSPLHNLIVLSYKRSQNLFALFFLFPLVEQYGDLSLVDLDRVHLDQVHYQFISENLHRWDTEIRPNLQPHLCDTGHHTLPFSSWKGVTLPYMYRTPISSLRSWWFHCP